MLIDTGPDPDRLLTLLDQRMPAWDRRIDLVVLTHPHEDHVAGLALLLDRYRIGAIAEPGMIGLGPGDAAYRRRMAELGRAEPRRRRRRPPDARRHHAQRGVAAPRRASRCARPTRARRSTTSRSCSTCTSAQRRMLFSGDVEEEIDPQLLAGGHRGSPDGAARRAEGRSPRQRHGDHRRVRRATRPAGRRDQRRLGQSIRPPVTRDGRAARSTAGHGCSAPTSTARSRSRPTARTSSPRPVAAGHDRPSRPPSGHSASASARSRPTRRSRGDGARSAGGPPTIGRMAIPTRIEAAAILRSLKPKDTLLTHSAVTGEIAAFICAAMVRRGVAVNSTLAETAALLHDVDKALPSRPSGAQARPRHGGAEWLTDAATTSLRSRWPTIRSGFLAAAASYDEYAAGHRAGRLDRGLRRQASAAGLVSLDATIRSLAEAIPGKRDAASCAASAPGRWSRHLRHRPASSRTRCSGCAGSTTRSSRRQRRPSAHGACRLLLGRGRVVDRERGAHVRDGARGRCRHAARRVADERRRG